MQRNDHMRDYAHARRRVVVINAPMPITRRLRETADPTPTLKATIGELSVPRAPKKA